MILVVDHYDSFTYNLVQLIEGLGHPTDVVKSDEAPAEALVARGPEAVVLSPGPGHPTDAGSFPDLLRLLTSNAHEVPGEHLQVPAGLRQLADSRGSTKSHTEARQLVAALQQAASA